MKPSTTILCVCLLALAGGTVGCMTQQTVVEPLPTLSQSMRPQKINWSDPEAMKKAKRSQYDDQKFRTTRFDTKKYQDRKGAYQGNQEFNTAAYQKGALTKDRSRFEGQTARWNGEKARTSTSRYQGQEARTGTFRDAEKAYATGDYRDARKGYREAGEKYETRTLAPSQISRSAVDTANLRTGDKYGTLNEDDVRRVLNKTGR